MITMMIYTPFHCRNPKQKAQVSLTLSESVLSLKEPGEENIPKEHRLDVSMVTRQTLGVFSHYSRKYWEVRNENHKKQIQHE